MLQSTSDIIEIMTLVRDRYIKNPTKAYLVQYRIDACDQIAQRRSRERNTISNAYIRELSPHIRGTRKFQQCLEDWILNNSNELIDVLKHFIPKDEQSEMIEELRTARSEIQKILDWEASDSISQRKYPEGRNKLDIHLKKERSQQLVADAKSYWRQITNGDIKCSVCDFSFLKKYGIYGKNFIEAHHNLPISELTEQTVMKISDLSPVCSNCHRIIHRKRPFLTVDELRKIIDSIKISQQAH